MPPREETDSIGAEFRSQFAPQSKPVKMPVFAPRRTRLFIIERRSGDELVYWNCSGEHGSGWNPHYPKQAFSPSELTKTLRLLIDEGWFADCTIRELCLFNGE
jgi:hypothetical protein